jgi:type I restriction enzyme, R subunit
MPCPDTRVIRASLGHRAKEGLPVDFINQTNLDILGDKVGVIAAFFTFAQADSNAKRNSRFKKRG